MAINRGDDVIARQPKLPGFNEKLFQVVIQQLPPIHRGARRQGGDNRPDSRVDRQYTLRRQLSNHLVRGVRIDLQLSTQSAHGRKRITRKHLPRNDRLLSGVNHLLVERDPWLELAPEWKHSCTITRHTQRSK